MTPEPDHPHVDLGELARRGATDTTPCANCDKPTRSHVICRLGGEWQELPEENPFEGEGGTGEILLAIVCHGCYETIEDGEWKPDEQHESAFRAVISG